MHSEFEEGTYEVSGLLHVFLVRRSGTQILFFHNAVRLSLCVCIHTLTFLSERCVPLQNYEKDGHFVDVPWSVFSIQFRSTMQITREYVGGSYRFCIVVLTQKPRLNSIFGRFVVVLRVCNVRRSFLCVSTMVLGVSEHSGVTVSEPEKNCVHDCFATLLHSQLHSPFLWHSTFVLPQDVG